MGKFIDLTGRVFGRWTVLNRAENVGAVTFWNCICTCGVFRAVGADNMRRGVSKSCGCLTLEVNSTQGGGSLDAEYKSWEGMVSRCTNINDKDYVRYGAKGISVYPLWATSFQEFKKYIGPKPTGKHSIDRVDGSKGYVPGNVRWATSIEQNANRKNTAMVDYQGVNQPLSLLARAHGLCPMRVNARVVTYGWSVEKALTTPVRQRPAVSAPLGADTAPCGMP